jgi:hypothetical protein
LLVLVGVGRISRKGIGRWIWLKYYLHMYENGNIVSFDIVLRMGKGKKGELWDGEFKTYCKHFCKFHNVPPVKQKNDKIKKKKERKEIHDQQRNVL